MKIGPECIPCIMRQALETGKIATDDLNKQGEALKRVAELLSDINFQNTPLAVSHKAQRIVRKITSVNDPYEDLKRKSNRKAMDMYPKLKKKVTTSEDTFYTASKLAVAGNVIDVGPGHEFEIEETIERVLDLDFSVNHYDRLKEDVENADEVFYLADNAGEIVLDRIFLEEMDGKEITLFVRSGPVLNDVTVEDAKSVGLDEISEIRTIKNGEQVAGLDEISGDFFDKLKEADVVISKGQGNYEAFSEVDANIFYILMAKCPLVARDIGVEEGDIVIEGVQY